MINLRRSALFALLILVVLIASCATPATQVATVEAPKATDMAVPQTDKGEVVFYGFAGQWDIWMAEWGKEFTKETGIKLKYVSGDQAVLVARIETEASDPQADLYMADRGDGYRLTAAGLLDSIPWNQIPNAADVNPAFKSDTVGTWSADLAVIGYNSEINTDPPTSWKDLADPKYDGKITINTPTNTRPAYIWMTLAKAYGEEQAWEILLKIFGNAYKWTDAPGDIEGAIATGESLASVATMGMVMVSSQELGAPTKSAIPAEGAIFDDNTVMLIKNAPNKENAIKFIDFMFGKYFQDQVMNVYGIGLAANPHVELTNEKIQSVGLGGRPTDFILTESFAVDWDYWMAEENGEIRLNKLVSEIDARVKGLEP